MTKWGPGMKDASDWCPPRPRTFRDLGFNPSGRVVLSGWEELLPSALQKILGINTAAVRPQASTNEAQAALPADRHDMSFLEDVWIDYATGTGGSFNPTYSIFWMLAQKALLVNNWDRPLPRGQILVLGGDLVQSWPSREEYEQRLLGPLRAAFPCSTQGCSWLFAIPGEHDRTDALNAFRGALCQGGWVGGWKTGQSRSYFAVELPHRWWLFGMDMAAGRYIDEVQLRYFEEVLQRATAGDRIVILTETAEWYEASDRAGGGNLSYLDRLVSSTGARIAAVIAGDANHYCRYAGESSPHLLTGGSAGAPLHSTHHLPRCVPSAANQRLYIDELKRCSSYPSPAQSRRLLVKTFLFTPFRRPEVTLALGGLYALLAFRLHLSTVGADVSFVDQLRDSHWSVVWRVPFRQGGTNLIIDLVLLAMIGFVKSEARFAWQRVLTKVIWGTALTAAHLTAMVLVARVATGGPLRGLPLVLQAITTLVFVGGLSGGFIMGGYIAVRHLVSSAHWDQAYIAYGGEDCKSFLRFHLDRSGTLTIFAIGLDRPTRRWRLDPDNADAEASWLAPDGESPDARLVEDPVVVAI